MRTLKYTKHDNGRVELLMCKDGNYYGVWFPVKKTEEYLEVIPLQSLNKSAQDLLDEVN